MVNLGGLPEPVLTPFPRNKRPAPKPVAKAQEVEVVPEPDAKKQERQAKPPGQPDHGHSSKRHRDPTTLQAGLAPGRHALPEPRRGPGHGAPAS